MDKLDTPGQIIPDAGIGDILTHKGTKLASCDHCGKVLALDETVELFVCEIADGSAWMVTPWAKLDIPDAP